MRPGKYDPAAILVVKTVLGIREEVKEQGKFVAGRRIEAIYRRESKSRKILCSLLLDVVFLQCATVSYLNLLCPETTFSLTFLDRRWDVGLCQPIRSELGGSNLAAGKRCQGGENDKGARPALHFFAAPLRVRRVVSIWTVLQRN